MRPRWRCERLSSSVRGRPMRIHAANAVSPIAWHRQVHDAVANAIDA
jgi:hypothetical protein